MRVFRKLGPFETWRLRQHLLRLSPEERRLRFSGAVGDAFVTAHCERIDWLRAVIIGHFENGVLRGAAELRLETGIAGRAELAVTVEGAYQDQGIGTELLGHAITVAANRAMRSIYMICLIDNRRMQHIARKFTDRLIVVEDQAEADLVMQFPTLVSLWQEAAADGFGFVTSWLEQLPLARAAS
jgi:GNAT superfamily N-acetyltransferase